MPVTSSEASHSCYPFLPWVPHTEIHTPDAEVLSWGKWHAWRAKAFWKPTNATNQLSRLCLKKCHKFLPIGILCSLCQLHQVHLHFWINYHWMPTKDNFLKSMKSTLSGESKSQVNRSPSWHSNLDLTSVYWNKVAPWPTHWLVDEVTQFAKEADPQTLMLLEKLSLDMKLRRICCAWGGDMMMKYETEHKMKVTTSKDLTINKNLVSIQAAHTSQVYWCLLKWKVSFHEQSFFGRRCTWKLQN